MKEVISEIVVINATITGIEMKQKVCSSKSHDTIKKFREPYPSQRTNLNKAIRI